MKIPGRVGLKNWIVRFATIFRKGLTKEFRVERQHSKIRTKALPFMVEARCIDVGASVYAHPRWKLFRSSPFTEFVLVDPDSTSLQYTERWNWPSSCRVFSDALWSSNSQRELFVTATPTGSSLFEPIIPNAEGFRVSEAQRSYFFPVIRKKIATRTLDEILSSLSTVPSMLKIDVQGGELEVLRGSAELFKSNPPVLIELETSLLRDPMYDGAPSLHNVMEFLFPLGYELLDLRVIHRNHFSDAFERSVPHECDAVFALQPFGDCPHTLAVRHTLFLAYVEYGLISLARDLLSFDTELHGTLEALGGAANLRKLVKVLQHT